MTPNILVVDDELDMKWLITETFKKQIRNKELHFTFALNGLEALEILKNNNLIDLVITDINMPAMDGLTLLAKLNELYPFLKTVIISAYGDMIKIRTAMNYGAFDFLNKPVDIDELEATVNKSLKHIQDLKNIRIMEEQLRHSKKVEVMSQLVNEIITDFSASNEKIVKNCNLLLNEPLDNSLRVGLFTMKEIAEKSTLLLKRINIFDNQEVKYEIINLNEVITNMDLRLRALINKNIYLVNNLTDEICLIKGNLEYLEQIIVNLLLNAQEAMSRGGQVVLETDYVTLNNLMVYNYVSVPPGNYVILTIKDSGTGISEEIIPKIFEPFFTTKEKNHGTGLGLTTVFNILKKGNGYISVESKLNYGTQFKIYFPAC